MWDWNNMAFGSGIPATVDTDYHHKVIAGTTRATVAGTDTDGETPLHINDLANSDDLTNLNRDRDNVQERHVVKDKHVRVFLPVIDPVAFKESLGVIKEAYFNPGEQPDFDGFKQALYDSAEAEEARLQGSDSSEDGLSEDRVTVAFLGEEGADTDQVMHTSIEIPAGEDEVGGRPTRIEEITQLGVLPGESFEVSVVYSDALDQVEIIYSDEAVKRRVVMSGEAFRQSMLGVEGDLVFVDGQYDVEGYRVHESMGGMRKALGKLLSADQEYVREVEVVACHAEHVAIQKESSSATVIKKPSTTSECRKANLLMRQKYHLRKR